MTKTSAQLRTMTDSELNKFDKKGGFCRLATNAQLEAMTPDELAEEAWWSGANSDPLRWSGTMDYVLLMNYGIHALVRRVIREGHWRGLALRPREVAQAIERLRGIRRLSARGKTAVSSLADRLKHCRRTGVALVQDGPDRRCRDRIGAHEVFHLYQWRQGLDRRSAAKALIKHPATSKALPYLRKNGYDVGDGRLVVFEMAAYIFSEDHPFIGLGRREAEDWFSEYCRQYSVSRAWLGPLKAVPTV